MENNLENFGCNLFSDKVMKEKLPSPIYKKWREAIRKEDALDAITADAIAHAMKEWALAKGCTHYTHWFHPLTGLTAEKHDSFIDRENDLPITKFSGKALIKGESDASSFPNGGLRATFEARGYTYWDCRSAAFIRDKILYIPSIFVSFNGDSLDTKKPLLASLEALSKHATRVCNAFGDKDVTSVKANIGLEQEYFLVDKEMFLKRRDLYLTGRTLLGTIPPKGQELEQHYYGTIPARVQAFMQDLDKELWALGIYAKSEHNEVAPGQFEVAPIYSDANVAIDQNMIMMDVMGKVALKHNLVCLLSEKPFMGVNGSGKHCNYSLETDTGLHLLDPGKDPHDNIRFLLFISALIEAVDKYPELIRLASSCPGNDFRLGANEAPPAIVSIFLGKPIEDLLQHLLDGKPVTYEKNSLNDFGMLSISDLPKDNSDRNRTSPIAFTGNKFEFRMLGSSMNPSELNIVINTILAESLDHIATTLEGYKYRQDVREAAIKICADIMLKHRKIIFNGDGYSALWLDEASKRGLPNIKTFIEAIPHLASEKSVSLFSKYQIFNKHELLARIDIKYKHYLDIRGIEFRTICSMIYQEIIPSAIKELNFITQSKEFMPPSVMKKAHNLAEFVEDINCLVSKLEKALDKVFMRQSLEEKALGLIGDVKELIDTLRARCDFMENYISKEHLPYPNYEDLLFATDF